jgi:hypothetical protein
MADHKWDDDKSRMDKSTGFERGSPGPSNLGHDRTQSGGQRSRKETANGGFSTGLEESGHNDLPPGKDHVT